MKTKYFLFFLFSLFIRSVQAQEIRLLANLSQVLGTSEFRLMESVEMGSNIYFTTWSSKGTDLWKTNGKTTSIVYRWPQAPYRVDYAVNKLYVLNNQLLFAGIDSLHGKELWTSDGTTAGTYMLKDLVPGKQSGFDLMPSPYNQTNHRYFPFTMHDGKFYFISRDSVYNHNQMWVTDGSVRGTVSMQPFDPVPAKGIMPEVGFNNGKFFLGKVETSQDYGTYVTDGTSSSSSLLVEGYLFNNFFEFQGRLLFNNNDGSGLWSSDGTLQNTTEIVSGFGCSADRVIYKDHLCFFGAGNSPLFVSDGTAGGIQQINDDTAGTPKTYWNEFIFLDVHQHFPIVFNGSIYFCGSKQLWKSDGTAAGTQPFKDFELIAPYYMSPSPQALIATGDKMYFKAFDSARVELFETDGTSAGTRKITQATSNYFENELMMGALPSPKYPNESMIVFGNKLLFTETYDTSVGKALYMIDVAPLAVPPTATAQSELNVYPNPATSSLNVRYPANQFDQADVLDVLGRNVYTQSISNKGNDVLHLPELAPGQYFVRLSGAGRSVSAPVIIQR